MNYKLETIEKIVAICLYVEEHGLKNVPPEDIDKLMARANNDKVETYELFHKLSDDGKLKMLSWSDKYKRR